MSFAQFKGQCYCCGRQGCSSDNCFKKNKIPKKDWAIHKLKDRQNTQAKKDNKEDEKGWNAAKIIKPTPSMKPSQLVIN